jgi:Rad3-related DNA helicase
VWETSSTDPNVGEIATRDVNASGGSENVFGTTGRATDFFVPETYRPHQRETIEAIEAAFEQGYRYVIVDAPTGSGKSHISRAFSFQSNSAHILTIQKLLQDQYQNDFPDMFIMKGRNAYTCNYSTSEEPLTCAEGPCQKKKRDLCKDCPYLVAKATAQRSPVVVHNFDSFYYQCTFGGSFSARKLMVIDEAHNIPGKFSDFMSFTIDSKGGIEVPKLRSLEDYVVFIDSAYKEYKLILEALDTEYTTIGLSKEKTKYRNEIAGLVFKTGKFLREMQSNNPTEYVFDYSDSGRNSPKIIVRPVNAGKFSFEWLTNYAERVIFMSATILDRDLFCNEVGINSNDAYYIRVPSSFPPENRPIIKKYAGRMSYKYIDDTLPKIVEKIEEIADRFPNKKGIIQTHSDKIAKYLEDNLDDPRFTFNSRYPTPQSMLVAHKMKSNSIIVASGLREGLDLRGDMSKVQIFCKVPYPSLGDKVVKRKLELNERWYGWITTLMFVQALGRSVRSSNEKAVTYILDSGFGYFYTRNKQFIPEYIKDAIVW